VAVGLLNLGVGAAIVRASWADLGLDAADSCVLCLLRAFCRTVCCGELLLWLLLILVLVLALELSALQLRLRA
jgi:hypothetical protein